MAKRGIESMSGNRRSVRLTPNVAALASKAVTIPSPICFITSSPSSSPTAIEFVAPGTSLPGLSSKELNLLRKKQSQLKANASSTVESLPAGANLQNALAASLIFAQYEAGSAVCIDAIGWILTCSHCFGDTEEEWQVNKRKWLLYYTGLAVQVECQVWDPKRDLALMQVIAIETSAGKNGETAIFCSVPVSTLAPAFKTPTVCIGQPGRDDLESATNRRTKYNLVEVSRGTFRGMIPGADPHDNSEIGTLKHDAWTYWGHSGAPLLREADGTLIGLHSSWDDQTAMRHGIPLVAITHFLQEHRKVTINRASQEGNSVIVIDDDDDD